MKISIVIPSYNQESYIEECVLSIWNSNFSSIEVICVDGGSTDGTLEKIEDLNRQGYVSKILYGPDEGQADALNKGFNYATGDYIGWINSDDFYMNKCLEKVNNAIMKSKADLIFGGIIVVDNGGRRINQYFPTSRDGQYSCCVALDLHQQAMFMTKSAYLKCGPFNTQYQFSMDYDYIIRLLNLYKPFLIEDYLGAFRHQPNSKTSNISHVGKLENDVIRNSHCVKCKKIKRLYLRLKRVFIIIYKTGLSYFIVKFRSRL